MTLVQPGPPKLLEPQAGGRHPRLLSAKNSTAVLTSAARRLFATALVPTACIVVAKHTHTASRRETAQDAAQEGLHPARELPPPTEGRFRVYVRLPDVARELCHGQGHRFVRRESLPSAPALLPLNLARAGILTSSIGRRHLPRKLVGRVSASSVSYNTPRGHHTRTLSSNKRRMWPFGANSVLDTQAINTTDDFRARPI